MILDHFGAQAYTCPQSTQKLRFGTISLAQSGKLPPPFHAPAKQANRVVDLIFMIDLVLHFFLMYPTGHSDAGVRWVASRKAIVKHYLTTWFALDFFSILLVSIDFVTVASGKNNGVDLEALRVLRVLRALRLVKLVRLVRASRMFKR